MRLKLQMKRFRHIPLLIIFFLPLLAAAAENTGTGGGSAWPWWLWPLILFVFCFALGIVAVLAGVGGGVLYVPLVSGFFPFHIDFVRGAGLMVALAGALAAGAGFAAPQSGKPAPGATGGAHCLHIFNSRGHAGSLSVEGQS